MAPGESFQPSMKISEHRETPSRRYCESSIAFRSMSGAFVSPQPVGGATGGDMEPNDFEFIDQYLWRVALLVCLFAVAVGIFVFHSGSDSELASTFFSLL